MNTVAPLHRTGRGSSGFTLLELLVAMVITLIMVGILSVICSQALHNWQIGSNRLSTNSDIRIALDIISTDLNGALLNASGIATDSTSTTPVAIETLHALPMANLGAANYQATTPTWLMFFSTPLDRDPTIAGNVDAISYQLAYQDDLQVNGPNPVLALYRTTVDSSTTFNSILGLSNIYTGYWKTNGSTPALNNFLIPNVIDFKVTFWYRDSSGNLNRINPTVSEIRLAAHTLQINPAPTGFDPDSKLAMADVSITVLTRQGALLLKSQALPMTTLARQYAYTYVRRIQLNPF